MKWLRRIVAVIVAVPLAFVGLLFLLGHREAAGRSVVQVDIRASEDEVFRHLREVRRLESWTGVAKVTAGSGPELRAGSTVYVAAVSRGRTTEMEGEVTLLEAPRRLAFAVRTRPGASIPFTQEMEYRLEPGASGTHVVLTARMNYGSVVARLFEPILTSGVSTQLRGSLERLKAQVEGSARL